MSEKVRGSTKVEVSYTIDLVHVFKGEVILLFVIEDVQSSLLTSLFVPLA